MTNIVLADLKTLYLNGKQIKRLNVQGKQVKMSYNVSFDLNMASGRYYYIAGQSGAATTYAAPATAVVPAGSAIGTLPTVGTSSAGITYTLSSVNYSIYVIGWYTEQSLTNQVTTSWVPTNDCTLYAKWKMTANVAISAAVTIPKFATSVSWSCTSNGGSRTAVSKKSSSTAKYFAFVMAAPGAQRNSDSYTWTGVAGKAITALSAQSMTLNGVTRTVANAAAGGTYSNNVALSFTINSRTGVAAGSQTYSSGSFSVVVSWPKMNTPNTAYSITIAFKYASAQKGSFTLGTVQLDRDDDNNFDGYYVKSKGSVRTGTFSSGTYGAAGGYGCSELSQGNSSTVSLAAASGTGYSRSITVNA